MPQLTTSLMNESIDIERLTGSESLDDRGNIVLLLVLVLLPFKQE